MRHYVSKSAGSLLRRRSCDLRHHMTRAEAAFWQSVRLNRLDGLKFRSQQVIGGYIADFYCHALWLAVEVDGSIHEGREERDALRDEVFAQYGIRVLRVSNEQVLYDLESVLGKIRSYAGTDSPSRPRRAPLRCATPGRPTGSRGSLD